MYGLPADFDHGVFVGRRLEYVTYGEHVIGLNFGDGLTVSVYGAVRYQETRDAPATTERSLVAETRLVAAVGQLVNATDLRSPNVLILRLENGATVTLLDDSNEFESYLLEVSGRTIAV
jgi:hypothetical protein